MFSQYYFYLCLQFTLLLDGLSYANPLIGKTVKLAKRDEFPYIVSISKASNVASRKNHFCGGTLISKKHVLTSAHCIISNTTSYYSIIINSIDFVNAEIYNVTNVITYNVWANDHGITPNFTGNDIAIITLSQEVENVMPAVISKLKMNDVIGKKVLIAGWGYIDKNKLLRPKSLQKAYMTVITDEKRKANEMELFGEVIDMPSNLYYTSANPPVAITCGDSGGPLLLASNRSVVGIIDSACNIANLNDNVMSLHLAIDCYRDFIYSVIENDN